MKQNNRNKTIVLDGRRERKTFCDCLNCGNSASEPGKGGNGGVNDILHCIRRGGKIVNETDFCEDWN